MFKIIDKIIVRQVLKKKVGNDRKIVQYLHIPKWLKFTLNKMNDAYWK